MTEDTPDTRTDETRIRRWANRHGHPIHDNQPIPEETREQYNQARAYMIRRSYAQRKSGKASTATRGAKSGKASNQNKAAFIIRSQD